MNPFFVVPPAAFLAAWFATHVVPHAKPEFRVRSTAIPIACTWHHYDGAAREFEVCDDHRTGRSRRRTDAETRHD